MAKPLPSRSEILECLAAAKRPLRARDIKTRCGVSDAAYPHLIELLDQLNVDKSLRRLAGGRFQASAHTTQTGGGWEGVLSINPRGFGFVTAAGHEDLYIAPERVGGAMHGDRVQVVVIARSPRGAEGRIEAVVARRNPRVAGVLHRRRKSIWLEPDDTRVRGPIVVVAGAQKAKDGVAAVVSITRFPQDEHEQPEAELVAELGLPGDPIAEVAKILVREQIEEEHPVEAIQEAESMAARLKRGDAAGRRDLRHVPLPTIDPEDARDHDDAIWVERTRDGYRAYVAIADVSEYVEPASALDAEAVARGCTIYLPDRAIPMLPTALAADLCSLLPDRDRLCVAVIAELDKKGSVESFELVEGVMRSAAMLTYGGVARALGFSELAPRSVQAEGFKKDLKVLDELAQKLRRARLKRGALDLNLPEARIVVDQNTGAPVSVYRRAQDAGVKRAYEMVEELMLLANELVARWLSKRRCPAIYRVHGRPDEAKLERLASVAEKLGVRVDLNALLEPTGVTQWLKEIQGHEKRAILEQLLLRSLKQANYDIANIGHFGLASETYLHFTSPIRRYPDIEVHRAVKRMLRGEKPDVSTSAVETLRAAATRSSMRERAAMDVEREVADLYKTLFMRDRVGETFEGVISSIAGAGVYVTLDDPFVDVLVRYEALGPDRYEVSEDEIYLVGQRSGERLMPGDRVVVVIEDVGILRRVVYARRVLPDGVVPEMGRPPQRGRGRQKPEPRGRRPPPTRPKERSKGRRRR